MVSLPFYPVSLFRWRFQEDSLSCCNYASVEMPEPNSGACELFDLRPVVTLLLTPLFFYAGAAGGFCSLST